MEEKIIQLLYQFLIPFRYFYLRLWAYLLKGCGEAIDGGLSTAVYLVARNTTEIWYSINFVLKGAWCLMINGISIAYNNIIIKSCVLVVSSLQTFSFWILSKWSNMHAAFQISGFFAASAIFKVENVSQLMWVKRSLETSSILSVLSVV